MRTFILGLLLLGFLPNSTLGQGSLGYGNRLPGSGIDAPVFDIDCQTRLEGRSFLAQAFVGLTPESLTGVGPILPFGLGASAGYIAPHGITLVGAGNQLVYTQLRAWEAAAGPTYEAAVASHGKHGFSNLVPMEAIVGPDAPRDPIGLRSFCLISEPPSWMLLFLGGGGVLLVWRRVCVVGP